MSKWDKLLLKITSLSKDVRFTELQKILESYGYEMKTPRSGSSHYTFRFRINDGSNRNSIIPLNSLFFYFKS